MAKLTLNPAPTFKAKVGIPVAGGVPADVEMVFKHRTKTQLNEWVNARTEKTDAETFLDMVSGWDLAEAFSPESVDLLLDSYIGAALATYEKYIAELVGARTKN